MKQILQELKEKTNKRSNLSSLRQVIKDEEKYNELVESFAEYQSIVLECLSDEDAKTRKNAALLLGDVECQDAVEALFDAYKNETTLFVKSAYLQALS